MTARAGKFSNVCKGRAVPRVKGPGESLASDIVRAVEAVAVVAQSN